MSSRAVVLVFVASACTTEGDDGFRDVDVKLSSEHAGLSIGSRRLDKPGTLGEVFYTITVRDWTGDTCVETADPLTATWSGAPLILLSHGNRTPGGSCTPLELAIARADLPPGDIDIQISDPNGSVHALFSPEIFETGATVPAMDVWQLEAGRVATFTWSTPIALAHMPALCFMTTVGPWLSCPTGTYDGFTNKIEILMPLDPAATGEGVALLQDVGVLESKATSCYAKTCVARIAIDLEHPAVFTVP
jgi:hypothetical protein